MYENLKKIYLQGDLDLLHSFLLKLPRRSYSSKELNIIGLSWGKLQNNQKACDFLIQAVNLSDEFLENLLRFIKINRNFQILLDVSFEHLSDEKKINLAAWLIKSLDQDNKEVVGQIIETKLSVEIINIINQKIVSEQLDEAVFFTVKVIKHCCCLEAEIVNLIFGNKYREFATRINAVADLPETFRKKTHIICDFLNEYYKETTHYFSINKSQLIDSSACNECYFDSQAQLLPPEEFKALISKECKDPLLLARYHRLLGDVERARQLYLEVLYKSEGEIRKKILYSLALLNVFPEELDTASNDKNTLIDGMIWNAKARHASHIGDFEHAYICFAKANQIQKILHPHYNRDEKSLIKNFYHRLVDNIDFLPVNRDFEAIFIVGTPRCGSTLLEHKITTDDKFFAMGESNLLQLCLSKNNSKIAEEFASRTKILSKNRIPVFKFLDNIFYVPIIEKMFPKARIIQCLRNKHDVAWSIFENFFMSSGLNYSTDFINIFDHIAKVEAAGKLWMDRKTQCFMQMSYSEFVQGNTETVQNVSNFIGSELKVHGKSESIAFTASATQIREKAEIRTRKWEKYYPYFDEDLRALWGAF